MWQDGRVEGCKLERACPVYSSPFSASFATKLLKRDVFILSLLLFHFLLNLQLIRLSFHKGYSWKSLITSTLPSTLVNSQTSPYLTQQHLTQLIPTSWNAFITWFSSHCSFSVSFDDFLPLGRPLSTREGSSTIYCHYSTYCHSLVEALKSHGFKCYLYSDVSYILISSPTSSLNSTSISTTYRHFIFKTSKTDFEFPLSPINLFNLTLFLTLQLHKPKINNKNKEHSDSWFLSTCPIYQEILSNITRIQPPTSTSVILVHVTCHHHLSL